MITRTTRKGEVLTGSSMRQVGAQPYTKSRRISFVNYEKLTGSTGNDPYIDCGNDYSLNLNADYPFSIYMVGCIQSNGNPVLSKLSGSLGWAVAFYGDGGGLSGGQPNLILYDGAGGLLYVHVAQDIRGLCHELLWAYDGSRLAAGVSAYLDGVPVVVVVDNDTLAGTTENNANFQIGGQGGTTGFLKLDDVALFSAELSVANAAALYSRPTDSPIRPKNLKGFDFSDSLAHWWRMGDGLYLPSEVTYPNVPDEVGNSHGVMVDFDIMAGAGYEAAMSVARDQPIPAIYELRRTLAAYYQMNPDFGTFGIPSAGWFAGTQVWDESGNGFDLTVTSGAPAVPLGQFLIPLADEYPWNRGVADFTGVQPGSYFEGSDPIAFGDMSFSMQVWFETPPGPQPNPQTVIMRGGPLGCAPGDREYIGLELGPTILVRYGSANTLSLGPWGFSTRYHVAITCTPSGPFGTVSGYLNNGAAVVGGAPLLPQVTPGAWTFMVGYSRNVVSRDAYVKVDQIALFNKTINSTEIGWLWNGANGLVIP